MGGFYSVYAYLKMVVWPKHVAVWIVLSSKINLRQWRCLDGIKPPSLGIHKETVYKIRRIRWVNTSSIFTCTRLYQCYKFPNFDSILQIPNVSQLGNMFHIRHRFRSSEIHQQMICLSITNKMFIYQLNQNNIRPIENECNVLLSCSRDEVFVQSESFLL
jgi:hypothetical protein